MLKCVYYDNKGMSLTGSKILRLIQAKNIPGVDLFVRETIQNSSDAIKDDALYGSIDFVIGEFDTERVSNQFERISDKLKNSNNVVSKYIAVIDKNTTGLLGSYIKNDTGKRNLYNLLYNIMEGKDDSLLGGGHGIGKTISSKFGNGITIYYSRTYEDNKYIHKLAATLVENEKIPDRLMEFAQDGIAYFGEYDNNNQCAMPLYDEKEISKFLSLFNLKPYEGEETGTITLIPFYNESEFLSYHIYDSEPLWKNNLEEALKISIQRWYFPRIDNDDYKGKKLQIRVNGVRLKLNSFFSHLQKLYNGSEIGCKDEPIYAKKIKKDQEIGRFRFKKFGAKELGLGIAPNNLPNPYMLLDINNSGNSKNEPIYFYTRRPGMIINYKDNFTRIGEEELDYMIGVFVLDDDVCYENESVGTYFKATEVAKHDSWDDSDIKECPNISKKKPFKTISTEITNLLKSLYVKDTTVVPNVSIDKLKKVLGQMLLPPEDYGNEPTLPSIEPPINPIIHDPKKVSTKLIGFDDETGYIMYSYSIRLDKEDKLTSTIKVDSKFHKYSFDEWNEMGFSVPVELMKLHIEKIMIKDEGKSNYRERLIDDSISISKKSIKGTFTSSDTTLFNYEYILSQKNEVKGFSITNNSFSSMIIMLLCYLKPIDLTNSIVVNSFVEVED